MAKKGSQRVRAIFFFLVKYEKCKLSPVQAVYITFLCLIKSDLIDGWYG